MRGSLERDQWELEDAENRASASGGHFTIPDRPERERLSVGTRVKLLFLFGREVASRKIVGCERMWVRVMSRDAEGFVGVLESTPVTSNALRPGAVIDFGPEHIASVELRHDDPQHPLYAPTALGRVWKRLRHILSGS
jgi:hypothetical protein